MGVVGCGEVVGWFWVRVGWSPGGDVSVVGNLGGRGMVYDRKNTVAPDYNERQELVSQINSCDHESQFTPENNLLSLRS